MGDIKNELAPLNAAYVHSGWLKFKNHRPMYTYTRVIMSLLSSLRRKKNHQVVFSNYNNYYSSADTQKSHKYLKNETDFRASTRISEFAKTEKLYYKNTKKLLGPGWASQNVPLFLHKKARKKKLKIEDKISLFWNELLIIIIITLIIDHHYQSPALLLVTFKKKNTFWTCYEKWAHFLIYTILYIQTTKKQK